MKQAIQHAGNWRLWIHGLAAAAISSAANGLGAIAIDYKTFNFDDGLVNVGKLAVISAIIGAVAYLKKSPVPEIEQPEPPFTNNQPTEP